MPMITGFQKCKKNKKWGKRNKKEEKIWKKEEKK